MHTKLLIFARFV